ncbi:MAG: ester cyclase [Thermoleophilaceae bacterium]
MRAAPVLDHKEGLMEQPIDVARDSIDAFNADDWDRVRNLHSADYHEEEFATGRTSEGIDAALDVAQGWKRGFPDAKGTVTGAYGDGSVAVLEIDWHGTNSGPMRTRDGEEMPATGREVTVHACQVFEVEDGKIKQSRHYFDLMSMLSQLGVGAEAQAGATR